MAMLGKRFQRTISMSQMGPGSNLHTEKVQVQQHQQQLKGEQHAECQPAQQWELLKNAEAMMIMMMANSGSANATAAAGGEYSVYPCSPTPSPSRTALTAEHTIGSPSSRILPSHHFLDACFLCKRRLRPERDIYIYRGDAAFCTEECRNRHILSDELNSSRASKKGGDTTPKMPAAA